MSSAVPVPPPRPAPERLVRSSTHRRSFWYKLRRRREIRRRISTATLWALTVVIVWVVLKQIIK